MMRCTKCILPNNYPGIKFDEKGICNYCNATTIGNYLGKRSLRKKILTINNKTKYNNPNYDCVLALSGGRDSSFLLYYLVRILKLRVLALFVDNGFVPEQTKENIKKMVSALSVKLVIKKNNYLEKCVNHHLKSFIRRPSASMVGLLCTGCRLGMKTMIPDFVKINKIPVYISGNNRLDSNSFKRNIMSIRPSTKLNTGLFVLGYLNEILMNPSWIMNADCMLTQFKEFYCVFYKGNKNSDGITEILPFFNYIRWKEDEIVDTIKNGLCWKITPGAKSTWRGDCEIALLKLFLYKKLLGYNDKDEGLSFLVRDGQLSRGDALSRLEEEGNISEEVIESILDKLCINFLDMKLALKKYGSI